MVPNYDTKDPTRKAPPQSSSKRTFTQISSEEKAANARKLFLCLHAIILLFVIINLMSLDASSVAVLAQILRACRNGEEFPSIPTTINVIVPLIFSLLGITALLSLWLAKKRMREPIHDSQINEGDKNKFNGAPPVDERNYRFAASVLRLASTQEWFLHTDPVGQKVTLQPSPQSVVAMSILGFFALIFNIFVISDLAFLWRDQSEEAGLTTLYLTPFVLVGFRLIYLSAKLILSLGNPIPLVTLNTDLANRGEDLKVTWRFQGNLQRLRETNFLLRARFEKLRGRHPHTRVETYLMHEESIGPFQGTSGEFTLQIPSQADASFETSKERLVWEIVAKGKIAFRPNVSNAFRFWVRE